MNDFIKAALQLARAQAGVRIMSEEEIIGFVTKIAAELEAVYAKEATPEEVNIDPETARKSIREKSVTCLECGKTFKLITKHHLATHGLTPEAYLAKYGLKKKTKLICKELQRARRTKMSDMQLWERRRKPE